MASRLLVLLTLLIGGCATLDGGEPVNKLQYGCNDVVVIGRIATEGATNFPDTVSLPNWRSEWQLQVEIKRVVKGFEKRSVVPATGVSHALIRDDRDFLAVLRPIEGGAYHLESAAIWDRKSLSRVIEPCAMRP